MLPCNAVGAHPVLCLDVCGGYQGKLPGYDKYLYRYYVPGPLPTGTLLGWYLLCYYNKLSALWGLSNLHQ